MYEAPQAGLDFGPDASVLEHRCPGAIDCTTEALSQPSNSCLLLSFQQMVDNHLLRESPLSPRGRGAGVRGLSVQTVIHFLNAQ
ncbi:MAG: hypothetical protein AMXMBFR59_42200 [Rhodanobacteraceae bacterium]